MGMIMNIINGVVGAVLSPFYKFFGPQDKNDNFSNAMKTLEEGSESKYQEATKILQNSSNISIAADSKQYQTFYSIATGTDINEIPKHLNDEFLSIQDEKSVDQLLQWRVKLIESCQAMIEHLEVKLKLLDRTQDKTQVRDAISKEKELNIDKSDIENVENSKNSSSTSAKIIATDVKNISREEAEETISRLKLASHHISLSEIENSVFQSLNNYRPTWQRYNGATKVLGNEAYNISCFVNTVITSESHTTKKLKEMLGGSTDALRERQMHDKSDFVNLYFHKYQKPTDWIKAYSDFNTKGPSSTDTALRIFFGSQGQNTDQVMSVAHFHTAEQLELASKHFAKNARRLIDAYNGDGDKGGEFAKALNPMASAHRVAFSIVAGAALVPWTLLTKTIENRLNLFSAVSQTLDLYVGKVVVNGIDNLIKQNRYYRDNPYLIMTEDNGNGSKPISVKEHFDKKYGGLTFEALIDTYVNRQLEVEKVTGNGKDLDGRINAMKKYLGTIVSAAKATEYFGESYKPHNFLKAIAPIAKDFDRIPLDNIDHTFRSLKKMQLENFTIFTYFNDTIHALFYGKSLNAPEKKSTFDRNVTANAIEKTPIKDPTINIINSVREANGFSGNIPQISGPNQIPEPTNLKDKQFDFSRENRFATETREEASRWGKVAIPAVISSKVVWPYVVKPVVVFVTTAITTIGGLVYTQFNKDEMPNKDGDILGKIITDKDHSNKKLLGVGITSNSMPTVRPFLKSDLNDSIFIEKNDAQIKLLEKQKQVFPEILAENLSYPIKAGGGLKINGEWVEFKKDIDLITIPKGSEIKFQNTANNGFIVWEVNTPKKDNPILEKIVDGVFDSGKDRKSIEIKMGGHVQELNVESLKGYYISSPKAQEKAKEPMAYYRGAYEPNSDVTLTQNVEPSIKTVSKSTKLNNASFAEKVSEVNGINLGAVKA